MHAELWKYRRAWKALPHLISSQHWSTEAVRLDTTSVLNLCRSHGFWELNYRTRVGCSLFPLLANDFNNFILFYFLFFR